MRLKRLLKRLHGNTASSSTIPAGPSTASRPKTTSDASIFKYGSNWYDTTTGEWLRICDNPEDTQHVRVVEIMTITHMDEKHYQHKYRYETTTNSALLTAVRAGTLISAADKITEEDIKI